jgi:hypothetical protein
MIAGDDAQVNQITEERLKAEILEMWLRHGAPPSMMMTPF